MKDKIRQAQIVVPCRNFDASLRFFTERLGFRVEMIFPADAPVVAVVSGGGATLRLEKSKENSPLTLRLVGDFSTFESPREIHSPDDVRVHLIDADSPVEIPDAAQEFIITTFDAENAWTEGRAGMLYRDLIPDRLGGRFVASHISIPVGGEIPDYVHFHRVRFQMIYCIAGWARLVYENQGAPFVMNAGDCVLQPPEIRHRVLESSAKFEVLEIGCPAIHETHADHALRLPNETVAPDKIYGTQRFLHHVAERAVWNKAEFEGFETRDTKIFEATGGLADVRVFRAIGNSRLSVKHSGEFLFFYILKGSLNLRGESAAAAARLNAGDSFVLPSGADYVIDADDGLEMIRVSLPARTEN